MALQVWLPLTKDLRNQGLSNVTVTNNGATFNSAGKLGGCYSFNGSSYITVQDVVLQNIWSYSCWLYSDISSRGWEVVMTCNINGGDADMQLGLYTRPIGNTIQNTANGQYNASIPMTYGQWNHFVGTFDGANLKTYLNGVLVNTKTITNAKLDRPKLTIGARCRGSSYDCYFQGLLNDVRIYDHCLSPMEVKQLSQGLVLHYPLNRQGFGQDNLMPNSVEMPVGSANPSTGTWRLAGDSRMTRSRVAIPDAPSGTSTYGFQSVGLQTGQDASCWGIDSFPKENGTTYTLSAWGRIVGGSTTAAMLGFSVYNGTTLDYGGTYGQAKSSDAEYYGSGAYDYAGGKLNPNGNWTRIYRTFTSTATSGNIYIGFNTAKTGNNVTLQLCGVKLEKGDKMTPWIPNSNESMYTTLGLNGTTEYDTSGYCNNGTRTGAFSWTSDTPKYEVSTYMPKAALITHPRPVFGGTDQEWTCAMWVKLDNVTQGQQAMNNFNISNNIVHSPTPLLYLNDGTNDYYMYGSQAVSAGVWTHVVFVFKNSDGTRNVYINGVLKNNFGPNKTSIPRGIPDTVTVGTNLAGYISDYRVYATALSADDVKSLYQNCATIDPDGTIRGKIR